MTVQSFLLVYNASLQSGFSSLFKGFSPSFLSQCLPPQPYCSISLSDSLQLPSSHCSCLMLSPRYLSAFWSLVCLAISSSPPVLLPQVSSVSLPPPPVCYACSSYILVIVFGFFPPSQEPSSRPWPWSLPAPSLDSLALSCHLIHPFRFPTEWMSCPSLLYAGVAKGLVTFQVENMPYLGMIL